MNVTSGVRGGGGGGHQSEISPGAPTSPGPALRHAAHLHPILLQVGYFVWSVIILLVKCGWRKWVRRMNGWFLFVFKLFFVFRHLSSQIPHRRGTVLSVKCHVDRRSYSTVIIMIISMFSYMPNLLCSYIRAMSDVRSTPICWINCSDSLYSTWGWWTFRT